MKKKRRDYHVVSRAEDSRTSGFRSIREAVADAKSLAADVGDADVRVGDPDGGETVIRQCKRQRGGGASCEVVSRKIQFRDDD